MEPKNRNLRRISSADFAFDPDRIEADSLCQEPLSALLSKRSRRRSRFITDREVPVYVRKSRGKSAHDRLVCLEAAIQAEVAARLRLEHELQNALTAIRRFQIRLAHLELAAGDATAPEVGGRW